MQEGNTPQSQPVVINTDESQPFLVNGLSPIAADSNHNDPELGVQNTVINLNNKNVRFTIWCIIYIIWTTLSSQDASTWLVFYQTHTNYDSDTDTDKQLQQWRLFASFNGILWWAAAIILCNLYCECCTGNWLRISAVLFVVGGIMAAVTLGIRMYCNICSICRL